MSARARVALVDDEPDFLTLVEGWLKPHYEVRSYAQPEGLCEELAAACPDLVLLDLNLGGADGFSLCRELRASTGRPDLPVLFLTGAPVDGCLAKPISRARLLEAVARGLEGRPAA